MKATEEIFEVVDEKGNVVGVAPRSRCHSDPTLRHRAVHVLVYNRKGELFLQQRSAEKDVQPGRWDSSVGGHLLPGEGYREAACREVREELGISLEASESLQERHRYVWRTEIETEHVRTYVLLHEGPFELQPSEISDGRFWTAAELMAERGSGVFTPNLEYELTLVGVVEDPKG